MHVGQQLHDRLVFYARANASIGINGTVLNNVNASPKMMTTAYINKVKAIADILRPYGIPGGEGESLPTCRLQPPLAPRQTACQS